MGLRERPSRKGGRSSIGDHSFPTSLGLSLATCHGGHSAGSGESAGASIKEAVSAQSIILNDAWSPGHVGVRVSGQERIAQAIPAPT